MWAPVAIAGQACAWAGVGASNARPNHSRTWGVKAASGTLSRVRRRRAGRSVRAGRTPTRRRRRGRSAPAARRPRRPVPAGPRGSPAPTSGALALELLLDLHEPGLLEHRDVAGEVAVGQLQRLAQVAEVGATASLSTARMPRRTRWWTVSSSSCAGCVVTRAPTPGRPGRPRSAGRPSGAAPTPTRPPARRDHRGGDREQRDAGRAHERVAADRRDREPAERDRVAPAASLPVAALIAITPARIRPQTAAPGPSATTRRRSGARAGPRSGR